MKKTPKKDSKKTAGKIPKKISWIRPFYNNKFVAVLSVFLAVVLWFVNKSVNTEENPRAIMKVPVKVTLSDTAQSDGLRVFQQSAQNATVYVTGNPMVVGKLSASDLVVYVPAAASITAPATYTLDLEVRNSDTNLGLTAYTLNHIDPKSVTFTVDRYREKTFNVESDITYRAGYKADPSYFVGSPVLSSDTVTISGPEKEVNQVNRVAYSYEVGNTLTDSQKFTATLVMYDANGNKIDKGNMTVNPEKVDVTIPVLPRKTMTVTAAFANKPSGFSFSDGQVQVSPGTIDVAGPKSILDNMAGSISLDPIDFSTISPSNNSFDANITLPSACKNLSNSPTAHVTLDLGSVTVKQFSASIFNVKNLSDGRKAAVATGQLSVTVVGPPSELEKLTNASIIGSVDLSDRQNFTGQAEVPVTFSVSSSTQCWIYGSYKVSVNITGG